MSSPLFGSPLKLRPLTAAVIIEDLKLRGPLCVRYVPLNCRFGPLCQAISKLESCHIHRSLEPHFQRCCRYKAELATCLSCRKATRGTKKGQKQS